MIEIYDTERKLKWLNWNSVFNQKFLIPVVMIKDFYHIWTLHFGLGNIWRFPYLCYKSGGGAFLIPYIIFLVICGIPLFFLEMSLGQFGSLGPIAIWKISPIFKGVGFGMAIVSAVVCIYYNVIIAWALYYIYQSYSVSWSSCENSWNTPDCISQDITNVSSSINLSKVSNFSALHNSSNSSKMTSSEEFWLYNVLRQSDSIEDVGSFQWPLVLTLIIAWILVFICVMRGIKTSGKVWGDAATQKSFILLCPAWGALLTMAGYTI
ncbi:sodium- and chloride-dependent glycine transporter 1 [Caerostris extrusa]|uniref:Transporter n=1 Tax=Caerostris extrusa TaxID=172846 RepID=A0AAV4S9S4_CAEEX|nr:sodium- and chloride-dependent glycine transporter 1 [Caerostris extrusa]